MESKKFNCYNFKVFFLIRGHAGFVLPRFCNRIYKEVKPGEHFGHSELVSDQDFIDANKIKKLNQLHSMLRRFTVQAIENCELLAISIMDLLKMKLEFPQAFLQIVESGKNALKKELMCKLQVIRIGEVEEEKNTHVPRNHIRTAFAVKILAALQKDMRANAVKEKKTQNDNII